MRRAKRENEFKPGSVSSTTIEMAEKLIVQVDSATNILDSLRKATQQAKMLRLLDVDRKALAAAFFKAKDAGLQRVSNDFQEAEKLLELVTKAHTLVSELEKADGCLKGDLPEKLKKALTNDCEASTLTDCLSSSYQYDNWAFWSDASKTRLEAQIERLKRLEHDSRLRTCERFINCAEHGACFVSRRTSASWLLC